MAAKKAIADPAEMPPTKAGPSLIMQIGSLFVASALAVGMGWMSGQYLNSGSKTGGGEQTHAPAGQDHGKAEAREEGLGAPAPLENVVKLPDMTTNLAAPSDIWVRLELSLIVDEPQPQAMVDDVHQDLLAFVRTLKLHQIEGASGLQHFKADLDERAKIRSGGHVQRVLIRTLLFE